MIIFGAMKVNAEMSFNLGLPDICKGDCSDHHLYDGDGAAWKGEGDKSLMSCQYNSRGDKRTGELMFYFC